MAIQNALKESALVVVRRFEEKNLLQDVKEIFTKLGWGNIHENARVVIKLNLSSIEPNTIRASNTDPRLIKAVIENLIERTFDIKLVESDGMRYSADEAFKINGIYDIARYYGIEAVNLSKTEQIGDLHPLLGEFTVSKILLERDILITMPCLKTHALTVFTGALKNQWGCISQFDRVVLHKRLHQLIPIINNLLKPDLSIMDGIWAMEGRGPTSGRQRYIGVILGSCFPASLDAIAMRLIGLDPYLAKHLVMSTGSHLGPINDDEIVIDGDFESFKTTFEPAKLDWAVRLMNWLTQYSFFVHHILLNKQLFAISKRAVNIFRRIGIVR